MRGVKFLLFILFFGYSVGTTWAHGGGVPQLANAAAGPYLVSVWTQPAPLRVGETHFTVAVLEPSNAAVATGEATGAPVLGATVELRLTPLNGSDEAMIIPATHENAVNKLLYEADLELPSTGSWQVLVSVAGPAGSGNTRFEIEVLPASNLGWIFLGGLVLVGLATVWSIRAYQQGKTND